MKKFLIVTGIVVLVFSACSNPFFPENGVNGTTVINEINNNDATEVVNEVVEDDLIFTDKAATVSLNVNISPAIVYNNGSAALTPLEATVNNTLYTERTAMLTVKVDGFLHKGDADGIELAIRTADGLICGESMSAYGMASDTVKIFTFTVTYNGTTPFDSGEGTITVTGLTGVPDNYSYTGGDKTIAVTIRDGQENYTGTGFDRRIPVNKINAPAYNVYANTPDGLTLYYLQDK